MTFSSTVDMRKKMHTQQTIGVTSSSTRDSTWLAAMSAGKPTINLDFNTCAVATEQLIKTLQESAHLNRVHYAQNVRGSFFIANFFPGNSG